jgi:hypothetical protein
VTSPGGLAPRRREGDALGVPPAAAPATEPVYSGPEQRFAEICTDGPEPRDPGAYAADAKLAFARAGGFGLRWAWVDEACARWPGNGTADRYTGPWNRPPANPTLVVSNTGDADLPYRNSVALVHDLADARLLTVRGLGHTVADNPSTCATRYEVSYLETGALPPAGTVCQQDATPFPEP